MQAKAEYLVDYLIGPLLEIESGTSLPEFELGSVATSHDPLTLGTVKTFPTILAWCGLNFLGSHAAVSRFHSLSDSCQNHKYSKREYAKDLQRHKKHEPPLDSSAGL